MTADAATFGALLHGYRQSAGLSQEELAKRSGLSLRAIGDIERGRTKVPHPFTVRRLAEALGLSGEARDEFCAAPRRRLSGGARTPPRQLPGPVPKFIGRHDELAALTELLDADGAAAPALVISAIGGMPGVGKTALAVHWAHRVAHRFPGGQLYVNLRGYDPGQPLSAGDALSGFLSALGVPGHDIPPEVDARAARYRSLLAGRKMLVLLDNAGSADQVRPLLPGTGTSTVLVTSRDALAGLVAGDGATRLDLDALPLPEAVALLRALIGPRVDAEPSAAAALAGQCCRLPLTLRVAAELAASRPALPLSALTAELADLRIRLDLLDAGGDPRTEVRTVFSWSYHHLDASAARTFRLLGLHPGPDFDLYAAAALTGAALPQARRAIGVLVRAHLISAASQGRHGMHDLLRGYASELAVAEDDEEEREAALARLFGYYRHTAAAAMDILLPAESHRRPLIPRPASPVPALADLPAARDWLDRERAVLVAAVAHTAAPGLTTQMVSILSSYLLNGGHYPQAMAVFSHALAAARRTGDRAAEATALKHIGTVNWQLSRFQQAADHDRQALALFRAAGDRVGEARALVSVGLDETQLGHYELAVRYQQEAIAIHRELGDRYGEVRALGNLGLARRRQGRYQEAADHYQRSLELSREIGDRQGQALALARLGVINLRLDRYEQAAGYLEQGLALFHETADASEPEALVKLSEVYLRLGRHEQAARNLERALIMSREAGNRVLEADALNGLGDLLLQAGKADEAVGHHAAALRLVAETGEPWEQARAHASLARACQARGDTPRARRHWREALTRYAAVGSPEADDIRTLLAADENNMAPSPR